PAGSVELEGELNAVGAVEEVGELDRTAAPRAGGAAQLDEAAQERGVPGAGADPRRLPLGQEAVLDRELGAGERDVRRFEARRLIAVLQRLRRGEHPRHESKQGV